MGVERLVALYEACGGEVPATSPDVFIVAVGEAAMNGSFAVAERLRDELPACGIEVNLGGGGFKAQMKRADKSGAAWVVIIGEEEMQRGEAGLKPLRTGGEQISVAVSELATVLGKTMNGE